MKSKIFLTLAASLMCSQLFAQTDSIKYDQHETFSAFSNALTGNEYRETSGKPSPKYWQNRSDYKLYGRLDTVNNRVMGTVVITYTNNSPDQLPFVWLALEQNIFKTGSRAEATSDLQGGLFSKGIFNGGFNLKSVSVVTKNGSYNADYLIADTRMQLKLREPLRSNGGVLQLIIKYSFEISENRTVRMGRIKTADGCWIYQVGQWYPRMCVYDDLKGWNTLPYLGAGEFYLDYGNYDVTIDVPANELVVASGELINPAEVLTPAELRRFNLAKTSDSTVTIRTVQDLKIKSNAGKRSVYHFKIFNSRDAVWAASSGFLWDAARINLPAGKKALAESVYPIESAGKDAWGRSTEFVKKVIEYNSTKWFAFPYPCAINVAGKLNGMEYPGMVFSKIALKGGNLFNITNHEFGHTIFPIVVGSNERKYAWMDEGFNTFLNILSAENVNHGEFRLPKEMFNLHGAAKFVFEPTSEAVMTLPDVMQAQNLNMIDYGKTAIALHLLRTQILGEERFDYAFKMYIDTWAYKHPSPYDFFNIMENAAGEDLGWFWKGWFINNWRLDQAVKSVSYVNNNLTEGSMITIENLNSMVMPAIVEVKEVNGTTKRITLPFEIWERGATWSFKYPSTSKIESVTIDPDGVFPDINPGNNVLKP